MVSETNLQVVQEKKSYAYKHVCIHVCMYKNRDTEKKSGKMWQ